MSETVSRLIKSIEVRGLFGLYDYRLPANGDLVNAAILYGDNGVGKSTLLRLAFHLLSPGENKAHRTKLFHTVFSSLEVELSSGASVSAIRTAPSSPFEQLVLSVKRDGETLAIWEFSPRGERVRLEEGMIYIDTDGAEQIIPPRAAARNRTAGSVPRGERPYLAALSSCVPTTFLLTADRKLDSDAVADPSDEVELRRVMKFDEPKRINDLVVRAREIALSQALSASARWISNGVFQSSNQGALNVHTVYRNVLKHLLATRSTAPVPSLVDSEAMKDRLSAIESKSREYARYELATPLSMAEFKKALLTRSRAKKELVASLLDAYVKSLESRFGALDSMYRLVDKFVVIVNGLLTDKTISFSPRVGFKIRSRVGTDLEPSKLSSGEQQLLLLLCYVLVARDKPSVFMIDEPEISLNIKWQRQLIRSLLDLTANSKVQFIFASHSVELISQHRERVVRLVNVRPE